MSHQESNQLPTSQDGFDLTRHLPHLLRRAHFEAEACFTQIYGDAVTSRQLALLVTVSQAADQSQAAVARVIGLDENTCSDLVRRAVNNGWLLRIRKREDRRVYELRLTAAGSDFVQRVAVPLANTYSAAVAKRLSTAEQRQLMELLRKMLGLHATPIERE